MSNFFECYRDDALITPTLFEHVSTHAPFVLFLIEQVERLPLSMFHVNDRDSGAKQYPPHMLLATICYAFCLGIFSSRAIERLTIDSLSFQYITGRRAIDHSTICRFIANNQLAINKFFSEILITAASCGFLDLTNLGMDGTKIKANANINRCMTVAEAEAWLADYETKVETFKQDITNVLTQIEMIGDGTDDQTANELEQLSSQLRGLKSKIKQFAIDKEAIEKGLAQAKIDAEDIAEYNYIKRKNQRQLKQREQEVPDNQDSSPLTTEFTADNQSHQMPKGLQNARDKAVPKSSQRINLTDPTSHRMKPTGKGIIQSYNVQTINDLSENRMITGIRVVSNANDRQQLLANIAEVPTNHGKIETVVADGGYFNSYEIKMANQQNINCLVNPGKIAESKLKPFKEAMVNQLEQLDNKKLLRARSSVNEGTFGQIKANMNYTKIFRRGLDMVNTEVQIVGIAYNLCRLYKLISR